MKLRIILFQILLQKSMGEMLEEQVDVEALVEES